jgi:hypothetical protein
MEELQLYSKINALPNDIKSEVNDFIDFLLSKKRKAIKQKKAVFGCAKGQFYIAPDFDKPLDDFEEYVK